jgi:hypothetical protein
MVAMDILNIVKKIEMQTSPYFHKMSRKYRANFRQEFPQLCAVPKADAPLSFSHIKDIVEPPPVIIKTLPYGWVDLQKPETYLGVTFLPTMSTHHRMCMAIHTMRKRWIAHNIAYDLEERYDEEIEYEVEEEEETDDTMSAEDPEYESDF